MSQRPAIATLALSAILGLGACTLPNELPDDVSFTEVDLTSPRWFVSAERDSAFAANYPYRYNSGVTTTERRVIRKPEEFATLWTQLDEGRSPSTPVPSVDFGEEMVIFAAMGQRFSGGYSLSIRHVTMLRDTLFVLVSERAPGPRCFVTAALTAPTDARVVPRTTAPVRFRIQQEELDCR